MSTQMVCEMGLSSVLWLLTSVLSSRRHRPFLMPRSHLGYATDVQLHCPHSHWSRSRSKVYTLGTVQTMFTVPLECFPTLVPLPTFPFVLRDTSPRSRLEFCSLGALPALESTSSRRGTRFLCMPPPVVSPAVSPVIPRAEVGIPFHVSTSLLENTTAAFTPAVPPLSVAMPATSSPAFAAAVIPVGGTSYVPLRSRGELSTSNLSSPQIHPVVLGLRGGNVTVSCRLQRSDIIALSMVTFTLIVVVVVLIFLNLVW